MMRDKIEREIITLVYALLIGGVFALLLKDMIGFYVFMSVYLLLTLGYWIGRLDDWEHEPKQK